MKFMKHVSADRTMKGSKQTINNDRDDKMVNDGQKIETITII